MYIVLGTDKKEYGPIDAATVERWIAERRATGSTLVRRATEPADAFKALSTFSEFQAVLNASVAPASPPVLAGTAGNPSTAPARPSNGLSIASFICGMASLTCAFLTGIPAIIMGHIAYARAGRQPARYGSRNLALAGLILGYVGCLVGTAFLAGLTLPAFAKAKARAQQFRCINNLKEIGLAARIYANENHEQYPSNFVAMSAQIANPAILICPGDSQHTPALSWADFTESANLSYEYVDRGGNPNPQQILFRCPYHHNVGLADGSVQQMGGRTRPNR